MPRAPTHAPSGARLGGAPPSAGTFSPAWRASVAVPRRLEPALGDPLGPVVPGVDGVDEQGDADGGDDHDRDHHPEGAPQRGVAHGSTSAPAASTASCSAISSSSRPRVSGMLRATRKMHGIWMTMSRLMRSEEHTSELQSRLHLVCRLLLEKKK